jgi:hypothetical protein
VVQPPLPQEVQEQAAVQAAQDTELPPEVLQ